MSVMKLHRTISVVNDESGQFIFTVEPSDFDGIRAYRLELNRESNVFVDDEVEAIIAALQEIRASAARGGSGCSG